MTREQEIEERLKEATPGPWNDQECLFPGKPESEFDAGKEGMKQYMASNIDKGNDRWFVVHPANQNVREEHVITCTTGNGPTSEANARLIARTPSDLRYLLDRIAELEQCKPDESDRPPDPSYEEACNALADGRDPWLPK